MNSTFSRSDDGKPMNFALVQAMEQMMQNPFIFLFFFLFVLGTLSHFLKMLSKGATSEQYSLSHQLLFSLQLQEAIHCVVTAHHSHVLEW